MDSWFTVCFTTVNTPASTQPSERHSGAKEQWDNPHRSSSMSFTCFILLLSRRCCYWLHWGHESRLSVASVQHLKLHPRHPFTYAAKAMGSVSSVITGEGLNNNTHYQAPDYRLRKGTKPQRRSGGCSLDGLLNCGFAQGSLSNSHLSKGLSHSRSGRSEDFFYIKVTFNWDVEHICFTAL